MTEPTVTPGLREGHWRIQCGDVEIVLVDKQYIAPCNCSDADIEVSDIDNLRRCLDAAEKLL